MKFWKMNGAGNDFIVLDNRGGAIPENALPALARRVCERRLSLGADGLMAVEPPQAGGDFRMRFFNADGSAGEMCGNGARCICRYGYENGLAGETVRVETPAGLVTGYRLGERDYRIRLNDPSVAELDRSTEVEGMLYELSYIELGSPGLPHAVVHIDDLADAAIGTLTYLGRALRYHPDFPKGANVNFYEITGKNRVLLRTYERGVEDFTYACGTGTGATVLALTLRGELTAGEDIDVLQRGGTLRVRVELEGGAVRNLWLTGPTNIVAKGELTDEDLCQILK